MGPQGTLADTISLPATLPADAHLVFATGTASNGGPVTGTPAITLGSTKAIGPAVPGTGARRLGPVAAGAGLPLAGPRAVALGLRRRREVTAPPSDPAGDHLSQRRPWGRPKRDD